MFDKNKDKIFLKKLSGHFILVTGGSKGIGEDIVKSLAYEGAIIAFTYKSNLNRAEKILKTLNASEHMILQMDISKKDSIQKGVKNVLERFGKISALINNAGITQDQLLLRLSVENFDKVIETNLRGTFLCTQAVMKSMLKAKQGSIVNITSVIGQVGNPGQSNYASSKGGIEAFSKSVAREVATRGIRVNCVSPGYIQTEMTEQLTEEQKNEIILKRVPMKRMGTPKDVAHAVSFLVSHESSYITGQTLNVNGGMYM